MKRDDLRIILAPWLMPGTVTFDEWCATVDHSVGHDAPHDKDDLRDPNYAEFVINRELDFESLLTTYR